MNNNVGMSIKKFFTNKNTVTIIGVVLIVLILYIFYNWRIKSMTTPISVPYAIETLKAGTQITSAKIGTLNVPKAALKGTIITDPRGVINKYVRGDSIIPEGSLFYSRSVVEKEQLEGVEALEYPDGYVLVNFSVTTESTYGKLIYPGDYVDLYLKIMYSGENLSEADSNKLTVGKLLNNVKILKVVDSDGNNVFADLENKGTPSQIIFAVPSEYHILLRKAMYLRSYESTIIPVPIKMNTDEAPTPTVSSNELVNFINSVTAWSGDGRTDTELNLPATSPSANIDPNQGVAGQ